MPKIGAKTYLPDEKLRQTALNLLTYRGRSCAELRDRLLAKGFGAAEVDVLIGRFIEVRLLDDRRFALDLAHYHRRTHPLGSYGLERALRTKGIDAELAKEITAAELPLEIEVELAREVIKRLLNQRLDFKSKYKRAMGLLGRRGFSTHAINKVQAILLKNKEFDEFPEEAE